MLEHGSANSFRRISDKNSTIIEDGMGNNLSSTLYAYRNDLFYLRVPSHLKELKNFENALGSLSVQMDKISFVIMSLKKEEKNTLMLLVNMKLTDHIPLLHLMRH
jgi:hypothetical protein